MITLLEFISYISSQNHMGYSHPLTPQKGVNCPRIPLIFTLQTVVIDYFIVKLHKYTSNEPINGDWKKYGYLCLRSGQSKMRNVDCDQISACLTFREGQGFLLANQRVATCGCLPSCMLFFNRTDRNWQYNHCWIQIKKVSFNANINHVTSFPGHCASKHWSKTYTE